MKPLAVSLALLLGWLSSPARAAEPAPSHTVMVRMRDGVRLATDIYLPAGGKGPWPCLLMRTPYGRAQYNVEVGSMADWGYAVAIQDLRGRFDSEGKAMAFQADGWGEQQDGYDTVAWLARQRFSNGRVGTLGASAMGIAQVLLAPTAPPALVCQYLSVAPASLYHEATHVGGVLRKDQVENYLAGQAHPDALEEVLAHPVYDAYWEAFDAAKVAGRVRVPAIHYGGWYDTFSEGTINGFLARQHRGAAGARGRQKLVMGPWTHGGSGKTEFGDFTLPPQARRVPFDVSARRWFDFHLKGRTNGADQLPAVIYYVMGPFDGTPSSGNVWRTADDWPVPARPTAFHLAAGGRLLENEGPSPSARAWFAHDPANPVPTVGGRNLYLPAGPMDQREIESRPDVLVFSTATLADDVEVTGPVIVRVFVSTDGGPGALAARLCDVYPDGRSIVIAEGIQRWTSGPRSSSDRTPSGDRPEEGGRKADEPESAREIAVDLWSTSIVFAKGHRIRLSLSGSNYPRWEVLCDRRGSGADNTDDNAQPPTGITVWMGGPYASRLLLPLTCPQSAPLGTTNRRGGDTRALPVFGASDRHPTRFQGNR